jgi:hypothetical protein
MAIEAPSAVVLDEEDVLVSPTPKQTAKRAPAVTRDIVFLRKKYWRIATQGVVIIFASLERA